MAAKEPREMHVEGTNIDIGFTHGRRGLIIEQQNDIIILDDARQVDAFIKALQSRREVMPHA